MMKVVFRADGNSTMGLGHIMRSSALMQILQPHFEVVFYSRNTKYFPIADFIENPQLVSLEKEITFEDEAGKIAASLESNTIIVLDGYQFTTAYQKILKHAGLKIVCIDDIMSYHFVADAIINHAGGISPEKYSCEGYTRLFLGPRYALVKPFFYEFQTHEITLDENKLLIALGGADPQNTTDTILTCVGRSGFKEVHVLLGAANKNAMSLSEKYKYDTAIIFHQNITGASVAQLMAGCRQAVLAPSTVCYEYMTVGGTVYLFQIASNQENIKKYFLETQLAFPFDKIGKADNAQRSAQQKKQQTVFDGQSPQHLLQIFMNLAN